MKYTASQLGRYGTKSAQGDRLVWWKKTADKGYWYEHFNRLIDSQHKEASKGQLGILENVLVRYLPTHGRLLEAGCGTGYLVAALRMRGYEIEGVDNSPNLINTVLERYPTLPIRPGDVTQLNVPDNYYQAYISIGVIEHRWEGPTPFLVEAKRIVSTGGRLLISVPYFNLLRRAKSRLGMYPANEAGLPFYQYGFTRDYFRQQLQHAGLKVLGFKYLGTRRCIAEEFYGVHNWLSNTRLVWRLLRLLNRLDPLGAMAHMILAIAEKPTFEDA